MKTVTNAITATTLSALAGTTVGVVGWINGDWDVRCVPALAIVAVLLLVCCAIGSVLGTALSHVVDR
jgi:hypothetical protein